MLISTGLSLSLSATCKKHDKGACEFHNPAPAQFHDPGKFFPPRGKRHKAEILCRLVRQ